MLVRYQAAPRPDLPMIYTLDLAEKGLLTTTNTRTPRAWLAAHHGLPCSVLFLFSSHLNAILVTTCTLPFYRPRQTALSYLRNAKSQFGVSNEDFDQAHEKVFTSTVSGVMVFLPTKVALLRRSKQR